MWDEKEVSKQTAREEAEALRWALSQLGVAHPREPEHAERAFRRLLAAAERRAG